VSARYRHRKNRPLHELRHGWYHLNLHRRGIQHRHRRGQRLKPPPSTVSTWRAVPRRLWPRELRRQFLAGALIGAGALVVACSVLGVLAFLHARSDLSRAQNIARNIIDDRNLLLTTAGRTRAAHELSLMHYYANRADNQIDGSIAITVMRAVPVLGHQVSGLVATVHGVDTVASQGQALLARAIDAIAASHGTSISLPQVKLLDAQVHRSSVALASVIAPAGGLWGPAHTERVKLNRVVERIVDLLQRGGRALDFAQPFLGADGPRVYLVVGENNSEMRDQGAVLSWALLHADNGTFTMSSAASVGTIALRAPAAPIEEAGTREVFGPLDPTQIWQSTNANGDFPTSSRWMISMFQAARGIHVDGVIGVDVQTLADILRVTGAVKVHSIHPRVSSSNVAPLLLFNLYTKYPVGSQAARHDDITAVAQAAVHKMRHGHYDLGAFFQALAQASQGRHLLFYDTDPALERTVVDFGGSGALLARGDQDVHLAIEAGVAAKLDWFMYSTVTYDVRVDTHGTAYVTTHITLHNDAPADAKPSYAMGPDNTNSHVAGEYIARIYEWLPPSAQAPGALSEEHLSLQRAIEPVYAQQTQSVVLSAIMLNAVRHGVLTLHFIPQSLIHPSNVTVNFTAADGFDGPVQTTWTGDRFVTLRWRSNP
jgi:hypothetical protein